MLRNSLTERLDRLEDRLWSRYPELAPRSDPRWRRAAHERLHATLSRDSLNELVKGMDLYWVPPQEMLDPSSRGARNLYLASGTVLWRGLEFGAPLDLSDRVAKIYLADPDAKPADVCCKCHYAVPASPQRRYFEQCPHCGGELRLDPRYKARWKRQRA